MKKKSGLFVKINYKCCSGTAKKSTVSDIKGSKQDELQLRKYLLCGGMFNKDGGTMIFQAQSMEEAWDIATNNPFIRSNMYRYEILNGDVISLAV